MAKVLVTGGCGYIGSVLVPKLLRDGHRVSVVDLQWFGNHLKPHPNLTVTNADVGDFLIGEHDAVIHLAAIANDPSGALNPKLTWETNALATTRLADLCARSGVNRFIYASSGSVYGIKGDLEVTEDEPCVPISEYNKAKMVSERAVLSYSDKMNVAVIRPGTVCGYSPRQRLDITVNGMTMQALKLGVILLGGKDLMRANVHIEDLTDLYVWLISNPVEGVYNAAFENASIGEIAGKIKKMLNCHISEASVTDPRSYRINSDKIRSAGFSPLLDIDCAIVDLIAAYSRGELLDKDNCYNLRSMPQ